MEKHPKITGYFRLSFNNEGYEILEMTCEGYILNFEEHVLTLQFTEYEGFEILDTLIELSKEDNINIKIIHDCKHSKKSTFEFNYNSDKRFRISPISESITRNETMKIYANISYDNFKIIKNN